MSATSRCASTVITVAVTLVTWLNIRGVRTGATITNAFTVAKLAPLVLLIIGGAAFIAMGAGSDPVAEPDGGFWRAVLLVAFAFGGFEVATVPGGEARSPSPRHPRRAVHVHRRRHRASTWRFSSSASRSCRVSASSARPLGDAAAAIAGAPGATLIAAGALLSTAGYVFGASLVVPRIAFALAEGGQFPAALARIHPTLRTPWVAIIAHGVITWALAVGLTFFSLVVVNVLARLVVIGVTCAAVIRLRRAGGDGRLSRAGRLGRAGGGTAGGRRCC